MYVKQHYTTTAAEIGAELIGGMGTLTARQLWLIVRLCKLARRSCRHNTAFNAAMSAAFPYARFRQVTKTNAAGRSYPGLQITITDANGIDTAEDENETDEE